MMIFPIGIDDCLMVSLMWTKEKTKQMIKKAVRSDSKRLFALHRNSDKVLT